MKNILNKIYFHPIFLLTLLIFISIGRFRFIVYFMLLIAVHELGHILSAIYFKWRIHKIIILPFGGLTKFNELINRPLKEEFIIAISGILFQTIFYILVKDMIGYKYFNLINYFILIFNMLPIYPLDGSKLLNILFNVLTSFKMSLLLTTIISYILIALLSLIFFNINKLIVLILSFLLLEVNRVYKNRQAIFNKFLLERYLNKFNYKREKIVNSVHKMKKDFRHLFLINKEYKTEKYILHKMFDNKSNL